MLDQVSNKMLSQFLGIHIYSVFDKASIDAENYTYKHTRIHAHIQISPKCATHLFKTTPLCCYPSMTYQNLFLIAKEVEKGLAPEQKENVASDLFSLYVH